MNKEEIIKLRGSPCKQCGDVDKESGNYILGFDKTDVDDVLIKYHGKGAILCKDCIFK